MTVHTSPNAGLKALQGSLNMPSPHSPRGPCLDEIPSHISLSSTCNFLTYKAMAVPCGAHQLLVKRDEKELDCYLMLNPPQIQKGSHSHWRAVLGCSPTPWGLSVHTSRAGKNPPLEKQV